MRSIFKEVFVFFYFHTKKNRPKNSHESNLLSASVMTGLIGAPLAFNILGVLYKKYGFLKGEDNYKFTAFIFAVIAPFVVFFFNRGKTYLKEIEKNPEYKPRLKVVGYYFLFCVLTCGLWTFFF